MSLQLVSYEEKACGKTAERPELDVCLKALRALVPHS